MGGGGGRGTLISTQQSRGTLWESGVMGGQGITLDL